MKEPGFTGWLAQEIEKAEEALLTEIEQADKLRYVDGPKLRREYMEKIGTVEEPVLEAELDVRMLQRKLELIQRKRNRREPVDLQEIDRQLEQECRELLEKVNTANAELEQRTELSDEEQEELQKIYNRIVADFHPQMHPSMTDTEKSLYEKAVEAYKNQNLAAMQLIESCLYKDYLSLTLNASVEISSDSELQEGWEHTAEVWENILKNDYTLARQLYPYFVHREQDEALSGAIKRFTELRTELEQQIEQMQQVFPFNAAATLADPEKTQTYLDSLKLRKLRAENEKKVLAQKIEQLTEESTNAGR